MLRDVLTTLHQQSDIDRRKGNGIGCWPGNTSDSALIRQVKDDMRDWTLSKIVWVADRGFSSERNHRYLRQGPLIQGPDALTPSERRIADLMADGLTGRQIAESLYLTINTIEWHRRNIYRKLSVSSREALGDALAAHDGLRG